MLKWLCILYLVPFCLQAQTFRVMPRYYEGKYYLATEDYRVKNYGFFALDMETASKLPDTVFARKLYNLQINADLPMQDYVTGNPQSGQSYRNIQYKHIKAFDKIVDRDSDLLSKKKKEDKKNNIIGLRYEPSELVIYNEATKRYFLFSTYGIYSVQEDSIRMPAKTIMEYTGFRFEGLASTNFFNPNAFILKFTLGTNKNFYKVFDMQTGAFNNIPGLSEMSNIKCLVSKTSPYVIFYGNSTDPKDFHQRTVLFNYESQRVESNIRYSTPDIKKSRLYLHKNLLYCNFDYFFGGWQHGLEVIDLKNNAKQVFYYKQIL